jgi:hypothetical protein
MPGGGGGVRFGMALVVLFMISKIREYRNSDEKEYVGGQSKDLRERY